MTVRARRRSLAINRQYPRLSAVGQTIRIIPDSLTGPRWIDCIISVSLSAYLAWFKTSHIPFPLPSWPRARSPGRIG